jgi:8-amino-7-oxononanoate synthase
MATLSKSFGCFGAYAATSRTLADLLLSRARPLIYSTALPPALCVAAETSLRLIQQEPERRERLWTHIRYFAQKLKGQGYDVHPRSAIFPLVLGSPEAALKAAARLRGRGIWAKAIRPPTVPEGTSRLRFTLSAAHTQAHLDEALDAIAAL